MHPEVIENQKHLARGVLDQRGQKLNRTIRVEGLINNHPPRLALIGHRRNHRQLLASWAVKNNIGSNLIVPSQ
jgi:hypothetical protein